MAPSAGPAPAEAAMPKLRVYPAAPRRPLRAPRRGRAVATPWAKDHTGQPRIRIDSRPWLPEFAESGSSRWLMGWYDPTFGCDWYMPQDHELD